MTALHPDRASARGAIVFNAIMRPLLIIGLIVSALALFGASTGALHIPALEAMR